MLIFLSLSLITFGASEIIRPKVCQTKDCYTIAAVIRENMNLSVNPCDDFYEYACGAWRTVNFIPSHARMWSNQDTYQQLTNIRIKSLLTESVQTTDIPPVKAMKQLYQSCLDMAEIERQGVTPILDILNKTGGWPVLMGKYDWHPEKMSWQEIEREHIRLLGQSIFYKFHFEFDETTKLNHILSITPHLELPDTYKTNLSEIPQVNMKYPNSTGLLQVILTFAKQTGHQVDRLQLYMDVDDMIDFENRIRQIYANAANENDRMTLNDLQRWVNRFAGDRSESKINFISTIKYMFKMADIKIGSDEQIIIYDKTYYKELAKYLQLVPARVIVNYIQWNLVYSLLAYTTSEMRILKHDMLYKKYDVPKWPPRWMSCITDLNLKDAVSYMFVKEFISDEVVEKVKNISKDIQDEIVKLVEESTTLSTPMKQFMTYKVNRMGSQIGYPKWYKDEKAVIKYYDGLTMTTNYFKNVISYKKFEFIKELEELRKEPSVERWRMQPTRVNAHYSVMHGSVFIPAAVFEDPLFTPSFPNSINYGVTGFVIGHEMSHAVAPAYVNYDHFTQQTKWKYSDFEAYKNMTECFVDQYGSYTLDIPDENGYAVNVNGYLTATENVADNLALRAAFNVYKRHDKNVGIILPNCEFVLGEELFFWSYANYWCSAERPKYAKERINRNGHSPDKYRVIGVLSNIPEFAATFKCPVGSRMNPAKKCITFQ